MIDIGTRITVIVISSSTISYRSLVLNINYLTFIFRKQVGSPLIRQ